MSPEQISAILTVAGFLARFAGWPFGACVILLIIGPWMLALMLGYMQSRRLETVTRMYENNVALVKDYRDLAKDLKEVVIMNTQVCQRLADDVENNQYCPAVRLEKAAKGRQP